MNTGKVVKINSGFEIVINLGSNNSDIRMGQKFKVIKFGDIIVDPDTNQELGRLEIPCGIVEVIHIQENMSTLQSCEYSRSPDRKEIRTIPKSPFSISFTGPGTETIETTMQGEKHIKPLNKIEIGNIVIPIN